MTSIPVPTHPDTSRLVRSIDGNEVTIYARTADANTKLLDKLAATPATSGFVQKARSGEGTGVLGLYAEAVVFAAAGTPFAHMRFFVIDRHIYVYNRSAGDSRANWRIRDEATLADALLVVQEALNRPNVRLFGHPVLVELTADDLSAVESGAMPPARFRGAYRIERDFGRFDFTMDVVSKPIPAKMEQMLAHGAWVVKSVPTEPVTDSDLPYSE